MSNNPNMIHVNTTVWDSFTTETDKVRLKIDHQSGLTWFARLPTPCPLVMSREIHRAYCDHHGVEDPDEYEMIQHTQFVEGTLVSIWKNKKTLAITTYTSLLWRSNETIWD